MTPRFLASVAVAVIGTCVLRPAAAQERAPAPTNQLHLPLAHELADMLRAADARRREGKLEEAVDLYRRVLDADKLGRTGYQLATLENEPRSSLRRHVGVTEWAIAGLRALPPEGVKLFRARYDHRAGSAMAEARAARDPFTSLARVYELYPVSSHAPRILELLADLALERGEVERAARSLERLLAHHLADLPDPARVRRKLATARRPVGAEDPRPSLHLVRGDAANRASVDLTATLGPERFSRTFEQVAAAREPDRFGQGLRPRAPTVSRNLPLVHGRHVLLATADQVLAYDLDTGAAGPRIPRLGPVLVDTNAKVQLGGAIDQETLVAPLVDEVRRDELFRGIPIKVQVPIRKLAGFDLASWRWSWNHARLLDGTPLERWSFPSPPTAVEGVVFAPAFSLEGLVNCYVGAFDARTGERLWDSWIVSGQVEQTMFGEQATEPLCTPVAVSDGVVYHSTSFGCVAALDAATGRPLWVTEYEQLEVRAPKGFYADPREIGWENNAPVVESGVVVAAPLDSPSYYGLDVRSGEVLWHAPRRPAGGGDGGLRYVLGSGRVGDQGVVVLGGAGEVRGVDVRSGKALWITPLRGRAVAGRGCVARGPANEPVVLVPLDLDQLCVLQVETGEQTGSLQVGTSGNVMLCGSHALVTGNGVLSVYLRGRRGRDF